MPPNVQWCEENLCALVTAPANTWSNLAYVIIGFAIWRQARGFAGRGLAFYAPATLAVGVFSLVYHASYTFFFQFFDFVGMFVFLDLVIVADLGRLGWASAQRQRNLWLLLVVTSSASVPVLFFAGIPIQLLVAATVAAWLWLEFALLRARGGGSGLLWISITFAGVAGLFSAADVTGIYCDPSDHLFQGHAIWHVLTACSFYAIFRHHAQLPEAREGGLAASP